MKKRHLLISLATAAAMPFCSALAQQGYEFEVYDTHLTNPGTIELELNTNFVATGRKVVDEGLFPTHHMCDRALRSVRALPSGSKPVSIFWP